MNPLAPAKGKGAITDRGRYVVLHFAGMPLVLPNTDIHTLEPRSDVQPAEHGDGSIGWIEAAGRRWPAVCLDADLGPMNVVPVERRVCVLLHHRGGYAGVLCEAVTTLDAEGAQVLPLPPALNSAESPVRGLVRQDEFLGCLTSGNDLLAQLPPPADDGLLASHDLQSVPETHL